MGVTEASAAEVVSWRMRALGLTAPLLPEPSGDAVADVSRVASRMFAVQGQDWWGGRAALGLRTPGATLSAVHEAFNAGALVRSWPMRGTIHLLAAEDIGWVQAATNHRVLPGAPKRRAMIGLSDTDLERMTELTEAALAGGGRLSRAELAEVWRAGGVEVQGPWRYHVLWWLAQTGLITFGPTAAGGEPLAVLAREWITNPRELSGDEANAELATRFAAGRGPVTVRDLSWWSGLTVREAREAVRLASVAGRLVPVSAAGVEYWVEPALLDAPPVPAEGVWLLPPFDEHLLGYTERGLLLDPKHFGLLVPGRNGVFGATVVRDGRAVGLWKREPLASRFRVRVSAFPGQRLTAAELTEPVGRLSRFLESDIETVLTE